MIRWVIVVLALVEGAWLAFDGSRAMIAGDYVTPCEGAYAGQLGPWAAVVASVGINPRSTFIKGVHIALGAAWLVTALGVVRRKRWVRTAVMACAVLSLWYLPFGTVFGVVQIALIMVYPRLE